MNYYALKHQHKADRLMTILSRYGHKFNSRKPDILLIDHDLGDTELGIRRKVIDVYKEQGTKIIIYPHSATIPWWYDGTKKFEKDIVSALLVTTEAQKEVMKIIDPEIPCYSIGWYFCPQEKFKPPKRLKRILFAPVHPPARSLLREEARKANEETFKKLIPLANNYQIIVRHVGELEKQGLWHNPKFIYKNGHPNGDYSDIDMSDLVIAEGTFMYLSVARGKPTIGINQHNPIRSNNQKRPKFPKNWDKYADKIIYPLDSADGDMIELINRAIEKEQVEWRQNSIGESLQPEKFVKLLESILE